MFSFIRNNAYDMKEKNELLSKAYFTMYFVSLCYLCLYKYFSFIGVIVFCGMEKVYISCRMSVGSQSFQITDLSMAYFGLRLSQLMAD